MVVISTKLTFFLVDTIKKNKKYNKNKKSTSPGVKKKKKIEM